MEIKIEKLPKSKIKFQLIATKIEVAHFFDMATERLAKELKISGFRPGKVPSDVAKGAIGENAINNEAQEIAINDTYLQLITKENLTPIARPENIKINKFDIEEGIDWEGEVEIMPELDTIGWQEKLTKEKELPKKEDTLLEKDEVENVIKNLQKQFADLEKKGPSTTLGASSSAPLTEKGDWVSIDMDVVEKDKFTPEQLKKFTADGFALIIGEAQFIPGFEENLIGLENGSEKEFDVTFPENYHEKKLAGNKVKFKIKINEIRKIVLPPQDEKFCEKFGFKKIEELENAIEQDLIKRKTEESKMKFEDEVLKKMISLFEIDYPESLVTQETEMIMSRFVHDLEHHKGIKFSDYLNSLGKNEEEFKNGFSQQATENVKVGILLNSIRKQEKIEVGESDINEAMSMDIINQTAGLVGEQIKEVEEKIKERYKDESFVHSLENSILARKTIDVILGQIK